MDALVRPLEKLYAQAPALPAAWRETLVKVTPWLALIFGVLALVLGLLGVLGAGAVTAVAPLAGTNGGLLALWVWVAVAVLLAQGILLLVAYPSLKRGALKGWNILFLLELVWLVSRLIDVLSFNLTGIISAVIGAAIGFYILFQIKSYYK